MDPSLYKDTTTTRGFKYHYYFSAATDPNKSSVLFIHGFPSSAQDWRKVVPAFEATGYGIIVPDMLGYGGTDKPTETDAYKLSGIARDVVDILDVEGINKVIVVGHDWGCSISSRLANFYPERFHAFALIGLGYSPPATAMNYQDRLASTKSQFGYELFGYWEFFCDENSPRLIDEHWDSFLGLLYPADPDLWMTDFGPTGKLREWITADKKAPLPTWLSEEDVEHLSVVHKNGFDGPVNYYRTPLTGVSAEDSKLIPAERYTVKQPVLFVACTKDRINVPAIGRLTASRWCEQAVEEEIDTGHWAPLEKPDELSQILVKWAEGLKL